MATNRQVRLEQLRAEEGAAAQLPTITVGRRGQWQTTFVLPPDAVMHRYPELSRDNRLFSKRQRKRRVVIKAYNIWLDRTAGAGDFVLPAGSGVRGAGGGRRGGRRYGASFGVTVPPIAGGAGAAGTAGGMAVPPIAGGAGAAGAAGGVGAGAAGGVDSIAAGAPVALGAHILPRAGKRKAPAPAKSAKSAKSAKVVPLALAVVDQPTPPPSAAPAPAAPAARLFQLPGCPSRPSSLPGAAFLATLADLAESDGSKAMVLCLGVARVLMLYVQCDQSGNSPTSTV
jgi:hypothetical protein